MPFLFKMSKSIYFVSPFLREIKRVNFQILYTEPVEVFPSILVFFTKFNYYLNTHCLHILGLTKWLLYPIM
jgi:hypothetical protein